MYQIRSESEAGNCALVAPKKNYAFGATTWHNIKALLSLKTSSLHNKAKYFKILNMKEDARQEEMRTVYNGTNWKILYTLIIILILSLLAMVIVQGIIATGFCFANKRHTQIQYANRKIFPQYSFIRWKYRVIYQ